MFCLYFSIKSYGDVYSKQLNYFPNQRLDQSLINFCSQGFTIGSIGRLSKEKGYEYLIEAFGILIKKGVDARLVIMGEGYERLCLENLISELGLSEKVLLPGYIDEANLYIPLFNVFVISSLTEGLPITLLEAMQAEIPVVATDVGGISDVLNSGEAGLLIKLSRPEEIADAIDRLCHDEKLSDRLAAAAYSRVTNLYSSKTMTMEYIDVYNGLV